MTTIYKYRRVKTPGPNGATLYFRNADTEPPAVELGQIDDWWYVAVPDAADLPEQWPEIEWQAVDVTPDLRERLKAETRPLQLISQRIIDKIRERYPIDEELYLARIGVGAATGMYTPTPEEQQELQDFAVYVEDVRTWGRALRAELGL